MERIEFESFPTAPPPPPPPVASNDTYPSLREILAMCPQGPFSGAGGPSAWVGPSLGSAPPYENPLSRQVASTDMQYDLFGLTRDLDLRSNFDLDLSTSSCIPFDVS